MGILGILKAVLEAVAAYLQLKNRSFYKDLLDNSRVRQRHLINEIEKYRSRGDSESTSIADLLQDELLDEKRYIKHLSTFYDLSKSRSDDSDKGGDVHPTD